MQLHLIRKLATTHGDPGKQNGDKVISSYRRVGLAASNPAYPDSFHFLLRSLFRNKHAKSDPDSMEIRIQVTQNQVAQNGQYRRTL